MKTKFVAFLALVILTLPFLANASPPQSGHYFNPDRSGEGIMVFLNSHLVEGQTFVHFAFYTYEAEQGCYHVNIPYLERVTEENCHEPRWFVSDAAQVYVDEHGTQTASGKLLCPLGINSPEGLPVYGDPFAVIVGEAYRCADYYLESFQGGWRVAFDRFGNILPEDDVIFGRVFEFTDLVFLGTD